MDSNFKNNLPHLRIHKPVIKHKSMVLLQDDRLQIMTYAFPDIVSTVLEDFVRKTDGYVIADMKRILQRTRLAAMQRISSEFTYYNAWCITP